MKLEKIVYDKSLHFELTGIIIMLKHWQEASFHGNLTLNHYEVQNISLDKTNVIARGKESEM